MEIREHPPTHTHTKEEGEERLQEPGDLWTPAEQALQLSRAYRGPQRLKRQSLSLHACVLSSAYMLGLFNLEFLWNS